MAKGKKTGGRDFKPGMSGCLTGRPKLDPGVKESRRFNKSEVERLLNDFMNLSLNELIVILRDGSRSTIELMVAKVISEAIKKGDHTRVNFILDRMIGKVAERPEPDAWEMAERASFSHKKSFEDFCDAAGYPRPFSKQIQMKDFGMLETEPRMILGARGYGKTDYVVILGIGYDIYLHPQTSTNLIVTKSKDRSAAIIKEIQSACEKNGVLFGKANSTSIRVLETIGKDPSCAAVTIRTASFRGRHPKRIVLDDPVTEDDTSEATRVLVKKKWNEINKLASNILVIGQPAHKYDLYADLRNINTFRRMELPWGTIPELDMDLDAQRLAGVDEASIQASYYLKIVAEGSTPFDNIKYIDKFPVGESAVAWIDPSFEGGDYTALTVLKQYLQGIAVVGFIYKKAWNHCLDEICPQLARFHVKKLAFEANNLGDQPVVMLRELLKNTGIGVTGRKSLDNKHAKIMNAGAFAHLIHLSRESHQGYIHQVVHYEYGAKNDDAPDSLASCLQWVGLIRGK